MLKYERFKIDVNSHGHIVNTYVVYDESTRNACIIDPGCSTHAKAAPIFQFISTNKLKPQCIVLTHCHGDHICGVDIIKEIIDIPVAIYVDDQTGYNMENIACSNLIGVPHPTSPIGVLLDEHDAISLGEEELFVMHTPGHTKGSICLYNPSSNILFSGDTIMPDGHGRTDLPTGNQESMALSLLKLTKLLPNCIICPGHGYITSMEKSQKIISKYMENENYMEMIRNAAKHQANIDESSLETKKNEETDNSKKA